MPVWEKTGSLPLSKGKETPPEASVSLNRKKKGFLWRKSPREKDRVRPPKQLPRKYRLDRGDDGSAGGEKQILKEPTTRRWPPS